MRITRTTVFLAGVYALAMTTACGDDSHDTDSHDTHNHDTHDTHDTESQPATIEWTEPPPASAMVGVEFTASFTVETEGEIHVTELRACTGENHECGLGDASSFDVSVPAPDSDGVSTGALTLTEAGTWTVVAYAHVGPDPFTSDHVLVTVQ